MYRKIKMKWKYYKMMLLPDSDPKEELTVTAEDRKALFRQYKKALLIRYTTEFDRTTDSRWYYCIKDTTYDLDLLKSKRRNVVKKAIANFDVRQITLTDYVDQFHALLNDAFQAYEKPVVFPYEYSQGQCRGISERKTSFVLGAFPKGSTELVGYLWLDIVGKSICLIEQHVMRAYEKAGCNTALDHALCELYTQKYYPEGYYLSDGERNVTHETAFHDFLIKYFGFRLAPCKLNVYFNPKLAWVIKPAIKLLPVYGGLLKKVTPDLYTKISGVRKLWELSK